MSRVWQKVNKLIKNKRGFTLLEVLVAIALLGIVLPLTFQLFNLGANLMVRSRQMVEEGNDVAYVIQSNRTGTTGVTNDALNGTSSDVTIYYDSGMSYISGTSETVTVTAKKKGDVVYYTYD